MFVEFFERSFTKQATSSSAITKTRLLKITALALDLASGSVLLSEALSAYAKARENCQNNRIWSQSHGFKRAIHVHC